MSAPKAFICHSSKDKSVVKRLAIDLRKNGVEAWYDDWEILLGDSLRCKIDQGIEDCDYFLAIVSENSFESAWVQTELDAGMVKRIQGSCRLIPVLLGISPEQLPPTLAGIKAEPLDDYEPGLSSLVRTCHGISEKPPLGEPPTKRHTSKTDSSSDTAIIDQLVNEGDKRFSGLRSNHEQERDMLKASFGRWTIAYALLPTPKQIPLLDLREVCMKAQVMKSPWPIGVCTLNEFQPYPRDKYFEAFIATSEYRPSVDFWIASFKGGFYATRAYTEDISPRADEYLPGNVPLINPYHYSGDIAEGLIHSLNFAQAFPGNHKEVLFHVRFDKLESRTIWRDWCGPRIESNRISRTPEWRNSISIDVNALPTSVKELIATLMNPLWEQFHFFDVPTEKYGELCDKILP